MVTPEFKPITLVLQFSYYNVNEAQTAGAILQQALLQAVEQYVQRRKDGINKVTLLGSSQSSVARLRHAVLDQEDGCSAVGDVLVVRLLGPNLQQEQLHRQFLQDILESTNTMLQDSTIRLEACKLSTAEKLMHAEQSCTQRVYHYLLPLRWLPDGDVLEQWWIHTSVAEMGSHTNRSTQRPPSPSLQQMKRFLRSAESDRWMDRMMNNNHAAAVPPEGDADDDRAPTSTNQDDSQSVKWAAGRFGALGDKKRTAWHNFADPSLQGSASPNTKPVWRVLDRARFQVLMTNPQTHEAIAVLEFRGDEFLPQQIRRLVGTTLAMTHGWLPDTTLQLATKPECIVETVLAPPGRLYLVDNRFHWDEMRTGGKSIFDSNVDGISLRRIPQKAVVEQLQACLLDACSNDQVRRQEQEWLMELEQTVCPRIRQGLEEWMQPSVKQDAGDYVRKLCPPPDEFVYTLQLLQDIIATGRWPETSVARSAVIGNVNRHSNVHKNGSFTVINPRYGNGIYKNGVGNDPLPLGNQLFPELVEAVFDLEMTLSSTGAVQQAQPNDEGLARERRPTSSHCAINCNAQFTPHVDSGRGAGQSLSMIVGLGDYMGGQLGVEGVAYDIRYQPLEFDGWRLRHWTKEFIGERFSLVWFTPELKGDEGK